MSSNAEYLPELRLQEFMEDHKLDFGTKGTDPMVDQLITKYRRDITPLTLRETILLNAWRCLPSDGCLSCPNKFAFVEERKAWLRYIDIFNRFMKRERAERRRSFAMNNDLGDQVITGKGE